MKFATIYKNGKPERFFIKIDNQKEWAFLQPYFLSTTMEKPRHGRILEMNCLFSGSVWQGRQSHGFGYSCSADVYGELIHIIFESYKKYLSSESVEELRRLNIHDENLTLSARLLDELRALNDAELEKRLSEV